MIPENHMKSRALESIPLAELLDYGVWEFDSEAGDHDETWVYPIAGSPVDDLANRVVALRVTLADSTVLTALLGNISLLDIHKTEQFLDLSIERDGEWFHLARYFDCDYQRRGPEALAAFLNRTTSQVFPISYDLAKWARGLPIVVKGQIFVAPAERLTEDELIALALQGD